MKIFIKLIIIILLINNTVFAVTDFDQDNLVRNCKKSLKEIGFKVYSDNKNVIHLDRDDIKIEGTADNTYWTAEAVFYNDEYNFYPDKNYVMFDIGFNLGMTSLWFARNEKISKIYAFEPYIPTCKLGERNLSLNPKLKKKIKLYKFGLSDKYEKITMHYNPDLPGSMSSTNDKFKDGKLETIIVKSASEVLKPLFDKHKNEGIFLKIDCEGAEREIIPDLNNSGLLKKVDTIIMEWHDGPPDELIKILTGNNFNIHCTHMINNQQGMIVAFKRN